MTARFANLGGILEVGGSPALGYRSDCTEAFNGVRRRCSQAPQLVARLSRECQMIAVLEGEGWGRFWGNWRIANRLSRVGGRNHFFFPALSPAPSPKSFGRHSGGRQLGKNVLTSWMRYGLAVLSVCLGIGDAAAVVGTRVNIAAGAVATPVAMCGRTCQMEAATSRGRQASAFKTG